MIHIYPFFHIALPLFIFEIPKIKNKYDINRFVLILSSMLPDILDKPLLFLNMGSGRDFFHTLLFVVVGFLTIHLLTKRNKSISFSFLIGTFSHLLLDLPGIPLFYPFVSYNFVSPEDPFKEWLETLLTDPLVISTEILGIAFLIFVVFNNKLTSIVKIESYLGKNSKGVIKEN